MVNTLMEMGLSLTEIRNLTDNEYVMILATKMALKEKEAEQMNQATAAPAMPKFRSAPRGMY